MKTHSSVDILALGLPDSVVAGRRRKARRGRMFPFPAVVHPENERDQDLTSPFYRRGGGGRLGNISSRTI